MKEDLPVPGCGGLTRELVAKDKNTTLTFPIGCHKLLATELLRYVPYLWRVLCIRESQGFLTSNFLIHNEYHRLNGGDDVEAPKGSFSP